MFRGPEEPAGGRPLPLYTISGAGPSGTETEGTAHAMAPGAHRGSGMTTGGGPARKTAGELRSYRWFGGDQPTALLRTFGHRSRMRGLGYAAEEHSGKPVIAILNTWSDLNPCHMHLRERAQQVKRGVWQAGGFPLEFPVATL